MKKFVSMLLVLVMVLAVASSAMAETLCNHYVVLKKDTNSYTAAKASAKTVHVAGKGSVGYCVKVCGKYAKVLVNKADETYVWFKKCDLTPDTKGEYSDVLVYWTHGGKGMSHKTGRIYTNKKLFKGTIKVAAHTNLRKTPSLHLKSQGVVEKCDTLKLTGRYAFDNRTVAFLEVCVKGKKLWVSSLFVKLTQDQFDFLYGGE